jgi:hypothetical protein
MSKPKKSPKENPKQAKKQKEKLSDEELKKVHGGTGIGGVLLDKHKDWIE